MINDQQYIKLFSNIIPVKGAKQSILCDSQRGEYRVIPNDLHDLLMEYDGCVIGEIIDVLGEKNRDVILEYMKALFREECIFLCDSKEEIDCFPKLDMTFETASSITNAILDIDASSKHDILTLIQQLNGLGCENLEIRIYEPIPQNVYREIYDGLVDSLIEYCVLIIPSNPEMDLNDFIQIMKKHKRMAKIVIHSCDETICRSKQDIAKDWNIFFTTQVIDKAECCGNISFKYFITNLPFITEAFNYNSCLNKKISIDRKGNIKNCPAMKESYGNLEGKKLLDVVNLEQFQNLWNINKDQIEICRDCEFRYICQDCRALIQGRLNIYSKPMKCKYDPYEATWKN